LSAAPTRAAWLAQAAQRLAAAGIADAPREARLLLRWASGLDAAALGLHLDESSPADEATRLAEALTARAARRPLSHITGCRAFWQHDFIVTPDVLDPRPETETLIALALDGPAPATIADIGTGSGCILLSLLAAWPEARGIGIDASAASLAVARRNADRLGLSARAAFRHGEWLDPLTEPLDMVVSNPPYLATAELAALSPEVAAEPRMALDGGADGLDAYRAITSALPRLLRPGGRVLLEIGPTQGKAVAALLAASGLHETAISPDLDGRPRVVTAKA
jgi:release factor glutamine methyltransferase